MQREEGPKASIETRRKALGPQRVVSEVAPPVPSPTSGCGGAVRGVPQRVTRFPARG